METNECLEGLDECREELIDLILTLTPEQVAELIRWAVQQGNYAG